MHNFETKRKQNNSGRSCVSYCTSPTLNGKGITGGETSPFFLTETKVLKKPVAPATPPSGTNAPLSTPRPQPLQPPLFVPISNDAKHQDDGGEEEVKMIKVTQYNYCIRGRKLVHYCFAFLFISKFYL